MTFESESRARVLARSVRNIELLSPIAPLIAVLAYLGLAVDLPMSQWATLLAWFSLYVLGCGLVRIKSAASPMKQTIESLSFVESGSDAEAKPRLDEVSLISTTLLQSPVEMWRFRAWTFLGLGIATPLMMAAAGFDGWMSRAILISFELGVLAAAIAASTLQFYWARSAFRTVRVGLCEEFGSGLDTDSSAQRISNAYLLRAAIVIPALLSVVLTLNLVTEQRRVSDEAAALAWGQAVMTDLLDSVSEVEIVERVSRYNADQSKAWPLSIQLFVRTSDRVDEWARGGVSEVLVEALDAELSSGSFSDSLVVPGAPDVAVFRRVDDTTAVIATLDRRQWAPTLLGFDAGLGLLIGGLLAVVWILGDRISRDLRESVESLRLATTALATGRPPRAAFETGDELSELGEAIHDVGSELRRKAECVSNTLEQVERTASDSMTLAKELFESSAEQSDRLRRAMDLVVSIDARGTEVSNSADALNESVDESSSSIAELGAAGTGLNETASILSSQIDEVSNSMEQMIRSVKQVGVITEKLAGASEETSSSMEEMASAMRGVDTSAESMASLSLDVVAKAELGQMKVCQTIEGMNAIREATDVAERVIRGLGSRTLEIGGILDVIDDVADETNLLALNAAIIAAQAGDQGKAFSVVADEIKELADRVLASTKEISGLIRSVQEESENAIGAIEAGSHSVMSGVDLSAEAGKTLEEITAASRQNGIRIGEIVSSVREQTKAAGHVVSLMENVRDSADDISLASSEQDRGNEVIYRSALTMREVAQQVRRTTEEQSHGFGRVRQSVEGVRTTVEAITNSLGEQAGACGEVSEFLQQACEGTRVNEATFEKLGGAMKELLAHAESLRENVGHS